MASLIPIALALVSLSVQEALATTPTAELRAFFTDATLILTEPETDGKRAERLGAVRAITFADRAEATTNLRELASRGFKPFIAEEGRDPR